jgi:16S rRNA G527 N7-methylase RsmG
MLVDKSLWTYYYNKKIQNFYKYLLLWNAAHNFMRISDKMCHIIGNKHII